MKALLILLCSGFAAFSAPSLGSFVYSNWVCGLGVQGHTNLRCAPITTAASGSTLLVFVGHGNTNNFAPSGNPYDTYNLGSTYVFLDPPWKQYTPLWPDIGDTVFVKTNASGGSSALFNSPMLDDEEITMGVVEVLNGGVVQDVQFNRGATGTSATSPTVTTTGPAQIICFWSGASVSPVSATANNGFTNVMAMLDDVRSPGCNIPMSVFTTNVLGAGSYSTTITTSPSQNVHIWMIVVQQSGAVVATVNPRNGKIRGLKLR